MICLFFWQRKEFSLGSCEDYNYLQGLIDAPGIDDSEEFTQMLESMIKNPLCYFCDSCNSETVTKKDGHKMFVTKENRQQCLIF